MGSASLWKKNLYLHFFLLFRYQMLFHFCKSWYSSDTTWPGKINTIYWESVITSGYGVQAASGDILRGFSPRTPNTLPQMLQAGKANMHFSLKHLYSITITFAVPDLRNCRPHFRSCNKVLADQNRITQLLDNTPQWWERKAISIFSKNKLSLLMSKAWLITKAGYRNCWHYLVMCLLHT